MRAYLIEWLESSNKDEEILKTIQDMKESFNSIFYIEQIPEQTHPSILDFTHLNKTAKNQKRVWSVFFQCANTLRSATIC